MKPEWIARQSRRPSGWLGELVARVMRLETRSANAFALSALPIEPTDGVLEVGSGHGQTVAEIARRVPDGFVAGVDPSDVMVRLSARRLQPAIERGRASVHRSEAAKLPFEDARFDAALAVHVLYFWPQPEVELREIRRVLKAGATLVLGFRPDGPELRAKLPDTIYHLRSVSEMEKLLRENGFDFVRVAEAGESSFVCLTAWARGEVAPQHRP